MKSNRLIKRSDQEFVDSIRKIIKTATKENKLLLIGTPLTSSYGDYLSNIFWSIKRVLSRKIRMSRVVEQKDEYSNRGLYMYLMLYTVEIYCIIWEDISAISTQAAFALDGKQRDVDTYRESFTKLVYQIVEESECEY